MIVEMYFFLHFNLWPGELCKTRHGDENVFLENEFIIKGCVLICSRCRIIEDGLRVVSFN